MELDTVCDSNHNDRQSPEFQQKFSILQLYFQYLPIEGVL